MVDIEVLDDPPPFAQFEQTGSGPFDAADHDDELGDRQEEGPTLRIGVALAQYRFDFESRSGGVGRVDDGRVVDDAFEDGERPDPHLLRR